MNIPRARLRNHGQQKQHARPTHSAVSASLSEPETQNPHKVKQCVAGPGMIALRGMWPVGGHIASIFPHLYVDSVVCMAFAMYAVNIVCLVCASLVWFLHACGALFSSSAYRRACFDTKSVGGEAGVFGNPHTSDRIRVSASADQQSNDIQISSIRSYVQWSPPVI